MIRISQIKISAGKAGKCDIEFLLRKKAAGVLKIHPDMIDKMEISRKSIDARTKPDIYYLYSVDVTLKDTNNGNNANNANNDSASVISGEEEAKFVKKLNLPENRCRIIEHRYFDISFDAKECSKADLENKRPVIVGAGPAGLFCGYMLAKHGYEPIIIERGRDVDNRHKDVEVFWQTGKLDPSSNVQFGEGGAGAFSDGKLNTVVKDSRGRNEEVLKIFVECGAPKDIIYDAKPHIGTDILMTVVKNLRNKIIALGGEVRFETCLKEIKKDGTSNVLILSDGSELHTDAVVLALGHSARDTFDMLYKNGVDMEAKPFAVGLRVEHPALFIDRSQYGETGSDLPTANYKLTSRSADGRGVYTFCMCPGGYVVNASSEEGRLAVNGMSYSGRDGRNSNSAVVVTVSPADYGSDHPLAGISFQRKLEENAYKAGNGRVPFERLGDFIFHVNGERLPEGKMHEMYPEFEPQIKGMFTEAPVHDIMSENLNRSFIDGMRSFGRKIRMYDDADVILEGIESRTSSPVRIVRGDNGMSLSKDISGIFPCGEGAGYAGGIMSAAMDGLLTAENVAAYSEK